MASASTPSVNVCTVQLKPMIKAQISGRMTFVTEHAKRAQLPFKIILSFSAKLRLRSILGKTFLAAIQYLQQFTYLRMKF